MLSLKHQLEKIKPSTILWVVVLTFVICMIMVAVYVNGLAHDYNALIDYMNNNCVCRGLI